MGLIESLFDIGYLGLVIALGLRLLLEKRKDAKMFGGMALLLGLGDAFHLIPRVLSHLTENGFTKYSSLLSYGQLITGITMTLFYVLFFLYYRQRSEDKSLTKIIIVVSLVVIRLVTLALPQNNWGGEGNYLMGIIRNIPFALLGGFIIVWCYQNKNKEGLKFTSECITVSFLCYLVVVLGATFVPSLGAFMMPKTVAYILLIVVGYKYFIKNFTSENLIKLSIVYALLGLMGGVFYREFSKAFNYLTATSLNFVHLHLLVLGFIFYLVLFAIFKNEDVSKLKRPLLIYNIGLGWTVTSFMVRGIYTITSNGYAPFKDAALSGIAGLGHIVLGVGLIYTLITLLKQINSKEIEANK